MAAKRKAKGQGKAKRTNYERQLARILDAGSKAGKVPPAKQSGLLGKAIAKGGGTANKKAIAWLRAHIKGLPVLVNMKPTAQLPPANAHIEDEEFALRLARSVDPDAPRKPDAADWTIWRHAPKCELWQAVLLSCGFEPGAFVPRTDGLGHIEGLVLVRHKGQHLPVRAALMLVPDADNLEIHKRLKVAVLNVGETLESPDHDTVGLKIRSTVSLLDFGTWAATIWPNLPAEFPRPPAPISQAAAVPVQPPPKPAGMPPQDAAPPLIDAPEPPLPTRSRNTLLAIVGLLARKAKLPVENPYTGAEHLMRMVETMDLRGLNKNTIAEILREAEEALAHKKK